MNLLPRDQKTNPRLPLDHQLMILNSMRSEPILMKLEVREKRA